MDGGLNGQGPKEFRAEPKGANAPKKKFRSEERRFEREIRSVQII
jgi:hypothetical protein